MMNLLSCLSIIHLVLNDFWVLLNTLRNLILIKLFLINLILILIHLIWIELIVHVLLIKSIKNLRLSKIVLQHLIINWNCIIVLCVYLSYWHIVYRSKKYYYIESFSFLYFSLYFNMMFFSFVINSIKFSQRLSISFNTCLDLFMKSSGHDSSEYKKKY